MKKNLLPQKVRCPICFTHHLDEHHPGALTLEEQFRLRVVSMRFDRLVDTKKVKTDSEVVDYFVHIYGYKEILQSMTRAAKKSSKGNPHPSTDEFYKLLAKGLNKVVDVCWTSQGR